MKYLLMFYFLTLTACGGQALYCQNCSSESTPVQFYPQGNYTSSDCKYKSIQVTEGFIVLDGVIEPLEEPIENNSFNLSNSNDLRYDINNNNLVIDNCEYKRVD